MELIEMNGVNFYLIKKYTEASKMKETPVFGFCIWSDPLVCVDWFKNILLSWRPPG